MKSNEVVIFNIE